MASGAGNDSGPRSLLVEVDPQYGVHKLVKAIKGRTSRVLWDELPKYSFTSVTQSTETTSAPSRNRPVYSKHDAV